MCCPFLVVIVASVWAANVHVLFFVICEKQGHCKGTQYTASCVTFSNTNYNATTCRHTRKMKSTQEGGKSKQILVSVSNKTVYYYTDEYETRNVISRDRCHVYIKIN